ncbi:MAG TPA: glycosyl hydrolase family 18 protein [Polyangia bacterium]|nr:glycosyl hydrolase family 18 protein [Polyangia bacterium]
MFAATIAGCGGGGATGTGGNGNAGGSGNAGGTVGNAGGSVGNAGGSVGNAGGSGNAGGTVGNAGGGGDPTGNGGGGGTTSSGGGGGTAGGGGTSGGGTCTADPWSVTAVYTGGALVSYNDHTYKAQWWTQGETPGVASVWLDQGACSGGGGGSAGGGGGGGGTAGGGGSAGGGGTPVGGNAGPYDRIGYFAQWGIYGRNFPVKSVVDTGEADKLTVINYAFENIDPVNFTCLMATKASGTDGNDPSQGDGAGDQFADYTKSFDATTSVDGVADVYSQTLKGNFNQLKKLKAKYPNLKVVVSLGGWTFSKFFSDVSATDASRKKFVASCIDMYIAGNIPVSDGAGGPGTAAGIFDGFDLDWEWPGGDTGHPGNHYSAADKTNYGLLMTEFRTELDALGKHYLLSAFLPADPGKISAGIDLPTVFKALDYGDVQGYDFHGDWEPTQTNHGAALYDPAGDPSTSKFSGDIAINAYLSQGVSANQITLGLPLYGYGWTGVSAGSNHGLWQPATGLASGVWVPGTNDYKVLAPMFSTVYHDTTAIAAWGYDGTNFWTFDDPWVFGQKAAYIKSKQLRGAMVWELDGDDGSLITALDAGLK